MRRFSIILALTLFSISQFGYYGIYSFQQYQIRKEMKHRILAMIPDSYEGLLRIDAADPKIQWEEKGEEFMLDGEMYDVAKTKSVDGKLMLYCINDEKEKDFLHDFSKAIKRSAGNSKNGKYILKFQLPDFCVTGLPVKANNIISFRESENMIFPSSLLDRIREVHAPPPRC